MARPPPHNSPLKLTSSTDVSRSERQSSTSNSSPLPPTSPPLRLAGIIRGAPAALNGDMGANSGCLLLIRGCSADGLAPSSKASELAKASSVSPDDDAAGEGDLGDSIGTFTGRLLLLYKSLALSSLAAEAAVAYKLLEKTKTLGRLRLTTRSAAAAPAAALLLMAGPLAMPMTSSAWVLFRRRRVMAAGMVRSARRTCKGAEVWEKQGGHGCGRAEGQGGMRRRVMAAGFVRSARRTCQNSEGWAARGSLRDSSVQKPECIVT